MVKTQMSGKKKLAYSSGFACPPDYYYYLEGFSPYVDSYLGVTSKAKDNTRDIYLQFIG